jgi:hypothetical protein
VSVIESVADGEPTAIRDAPAVGEVTETVGGVFAVTLKEMDGAVVDAAGVYASVAVAVTVNAPGAALVGIVYVAVYTLPLPPFDAVIAEPPFTENETEATVPSLSTALQERLTV